MEVAVKPDKKLMTVPEAAQMPITAYADDDGNGVIFVFDTTDKFGAIRGLNGKWRVGSFTDGGLTEYHLILDYDEVAHLVTAARTSLSL
jgi:hypothetical protein